MSSNSELSAFSESSNDDEDIDVVYMANTRCIILQFRSLVHNSSGWDRGQEPGRIGGGRGRGGGRGKGRKWDF